jgi:hypothetical protein
MYPPGAQLRLKTLLVGTAVLSPDKAMLPDNAMLVPGTIFCVVRRLAERLLQ